MSTPLTESRKANAGFGPGVLSATEQQHNLDITLEKTLATLRERLFRAGKQRVHIAEGGVFYVSTPYGQVMRFDSLASLQARADEVRV